MARRGGRGHSPGALERVPHILVVDDQREIRDLVAKFLTRNGLRVSVADGGAQMREVLARAAVDLVVLDIMMPDEDGLTLCQALRAQGDMPVILLTAVSGDDDRLVGLEAGADEYLTKPFNPSEFLARIRAVLRRTKAGPKPVVEGLALRPLRARSPAPVAHRRDGA